MGKRGPKPRFLDVVCPNEQCSQYGVAGKGNVTVYGTYQINSGKMRKYICHTCSTRFCDRTNTAFYDLRTGDEKVNEVVLKDVETQKVEMDEAWTFVGKNAAKER